MRRPLLLLPLLLQFLLFGGPWSPARAADLFTLVSQALQHDAGLAAARATLEAAEQAGPKARAALLPRLDAGWGQTWNRYKTEGQPEARYRQDGWKVVLSQPIFDWSSWIGYQQAELVHAQAGLAYAQARQDLVLLVAASYFQTLAAEEELQRLQRHREMLESHAELLAHRKQAGEATLIDLQDTQVDLEQIGLQLEQARAQVRLGQLQLEQLSGMPVATLARLDGEASLPRLQPAREDAWIEQARNQSYPVQIRRLGKEIAAADTARIRAENYPVVSLSASHSPAGAAEGYTRPSTTSVAMLQVSLPLFTGGGIQARSRESQAMEWKAGEEVRAAEQLLTRQAREEYLKISSGLRQLQLLQELRQSTRTALDSTRMGYRFGSRSSVDVLRAMEALSTNESEWIRRRHEVLTAILRLKAAAAALDLEDIQQINRLLSATPTPGRAGEPGELRLSWSLGGNQDAGAAPSPRLTP